MTYQDRPAQLVGVLGIGLMDDTEAVLLADDLGLTRGDGVFDATLVRTAPDGTSTVDHVRAHLDRFSRSAEAIDLPPIDRPRWARLIRDATAAWRIPGEAVLKVMLTRGRESVATDPVGLLTVTELSPSLIASRAGIAVAALTTGRASDAFTAAPWLLGGVKSLSYAFNVGVKREATRRGADDALLVSADGYALEGPTSSLIAAIDGQLVTTPLDGTGILASITQAVVFGAAADAGVPTAYRLMTVDEVLAADTAWLCSSVRGVAPITAIDGVPLQVDPESTARVRTFAGF